MQTVLYARWGDIARNFGEVAITRTQRNLQKNERVYNVEEGPRFTKAALLIYGCLDNEGRPKVLLARWNPLCGPATMGACGHTESNQSRDD